MSETKTYSTSKVATITVIALVVGMSLMAVLAPYIYKRDAQKDVESALPSASKEQIINLLTDKQTGTWMVENDYLVSATKNVHDCTEEIVNSKDACGCESVDDVLKRYQITFSHKDTNTAQLFAAEIMSNKKVKESMLAKSKNDDDAKEKEEAYDLSIEQSKTLAFTKWLDGEIDRSQLLEEVNNQPPPPPNPPETNSAPNANQSLPGDPGPEQLEPSGGTGGSVDVDDDEDEERRCDGKIPACPSGLGKCDPNCLTGTGGGTAATTPVEGYKPPKSLWAALVWSVAF